MNQRTYVDYANQALLVLDGLLTSEHEWSPGRLALAKLQVQSEVLSPDAAFYHRVFTAATGWGAPGRELV